MVNITWAQTAWNWFQNNQQTYAGIADPLQWHRGKVEDYVEQHQVGIPAHVLQSGSVFIR